MALEMHIYTIHSRGRPNELIAVGDGKHPLAIVPPFWALWRGLWVTALVMIGLMALAWIYHPAALGTVWGGLIALAVFEGSTMERLELRLHGWREVGLAEARSEEGAEELFVTGRGHVIEHGGRRRAGEKKAAGA